MRSHELVASSAWVLTTLPAWLLAFTTLVLCPLSLEVAAAPRWLRRAGGIAGALAALGLLVVPDPGALALSTALPYGLVAGTAGAIGLGRLAGRPGPASRAAAAAGLIGFPAAATWLLAYRWGHSLLGYPPFWVLLTSLHFHVAGQYLLIVLGRVSHGRGRLAGAIALACVVSVPLTAAGIHGPRWLELFAAVGMAGSAFGGGLLLVTSPRGGLRLAGASLLLSMPLAALFALRDHASPLSFAGLDPLGSMMVSHGLLNVLGFALVALLTLRRELSPTVLHDVPPMSRIAGERPVGATFLARRGLERMIHPAPRGLVDRLEELAHPGLDAAGVPSPIRAFYEHTAEHEMIVAPSWRAGFRAGARLWAAFARRVDQLQLPVELEGAPWALSSRIIGVDADADGRRRPRAWIRTFPDGRALYVAIYSTHERDGRAYMNIAFPLPGGHLTSILRMDHLGGGVSVSTRRGGDAGIWLVASAFGRLFAARTPMAESIDVWTTDDPAVPEAWRQWAAGYSTVARHTLWLFGLRFLTLRYAMRRRSRPDREVP